MGRGIGRVEVDVNTETAILRLCLDGWRVCLGREREVVLGVVDL